MIPIGHSDAGGCRARLDRRRSTCRCTARATHSGRCVRPAAARAPPEIAIEQTPKPSRPAATRATASTASCAMSRARRAPPGVAPTARARAMSHAQRAAWPWTARGHPVQMIQPRVLAHRATAAAVGEEVIELRQRRKLRRAQQARDRERAAGVRQARAHLMRLAAQITGEEAGEKRIAGPQHVVDLDVEARCDQSLLEVRRRSRPGTRRSHAHRVCRR